MVFPLCCCVYLPVCLTFHVVFPETDDDDLTFQYSKAEYVQSRVHIAFHFHASLHCPWLPWLDHDGET